MGAAVRVGVPLGAAAAIRAPVRHQDEARLVALALAMTMKNLHLDPLAAEVAREDVRQGVAVVAVGQVVVVPVEPAIQALVRPAAALLAVLVEAPLPRKKGKKNQGDAASLDVPPAHRNRAVVQRDLAHRVLQAARLAHLGLRLEQERLPALPPRLPNGVASLDVARPTISPINPPNQKVRLPKTKKQADVACLVLGVVARRMTLRRLPEAKNHPDQPPRLRHAQRQRPSRCPAKPKFRAM